MEKTANTNIIKPRTLDYCEPKRRKVTVTKHVIRITSPNRNIKKEIIK